MLLDRICRLPYSGHHFPQPTASRSLSPLPPSFFEMHIIQKEKKARPSTVRRCLQRRLLPSVDQKAWQGTMCSTAGHAYLRVHAWPSPLSLPAQVRLACRQTNALAQGRGSRAGEGVGGGRGCLLTTEHDCAEYRERVVSDQQRSWSGIDSSSQESVRERHN